jgi:hypothetical protein
MCGAAATEMRREIVYVCMSCLTYHMLDPFTEKREAGNSEINFERKVRKKRKKKNTHTDTRT